MRIPSRIGLKNLVLCCLICTLPYLLAGCFLRLLFGSVVERDGDFGTIFIAEMGGTWGPMAICDFDKVNNTLIDCSYTFLDFEGADPPIIERTSSAELISELGILGVFVDPLILQVPIGASDFTGTFDDGSGPHPIMVTETSSFNVQPGTTVNAEAGQKFFILEFPPDVEADLIANSQLNGPYDFLFEFQVPTLGDVDVKAMYTGRVEVGGQTFYVPMLPCVTDFAQVPTITIPEDMVSQDLMSQVLSIIQDPNLGCNGVMYDFTTLPVELTGFEVQGKFDDVTLSWSTASETDNAGFEIEHQQADQSAFNRIGFVPGNGTTTEAQSYRFQIRDLEVGKHRFRLRQIDYDGAFAYSDEVEYTVEVPGTHVLGAAYPNPFNPMTRFSIAVPSRQPIHVTLHDASGRLIRTLFQGEIPENQQHWVNIDGSELSSGMYLYQVTGRNFTESRKVTLQK